MGRNLSWKAGRHHAELLLNALHHFYQQCEQNSDPFHQLSQVVKLHWQEPHALWVMTTLHDLGLLLALEQVDLTSNNIRNILLCLKELKILEDKREGNHSKTITGSSRWQFILHLKSRDVTENLHWLFGDGDRPGYWDQRRNQLKFAPDFLEFEEPEDFSQKQILHRQWRDLRWVGRDELIAELVAKLNKDCRILSLVGITGIGKTALSIRLSADIESQFQHSAFVDFDGDHPDFRLVARAVLGQQALDPELQFPQLQIAEMIDRLQEHPWLLVLDMAEELLQVGEDGRSQFADPRFAQFFDRIVQADSFPSRIIITSQDEPPPPAKGRHREYTHTALLSGLSPTESLQLFQLLDIPISDNATTSLLTRMITLYEGHPLALQVIAGEMGALPYAGDVLAYWHDYGHEFERVEQLKKADEIKGPDDAVRLDRHSPKLVDWVKCRINRVFERLYQTDVWAYMLLCQGAVYRRAVERSAWLTMLLEQDEEVAICAFQSLQRRYLLEAEKETHKVLYRLHNLLRRVALDHLHQLEQLNSTDQEER